MSLRSKCFREVFLVHSGRDINHYTVEPKLTKHNTKLRKSAYKSKWVRDLLLIFMPFKENSKIVYVEKQNPWKTHPCNENRVFPVKFFSQGKTCFHYRSACNENRVPCNENRLFPVRKISQGKPCFHYRDGFAVW